MEQKPYKQKKNKRAYYQKAGKSAKRESELSSKLCFSDRKWS